MALTSLPRQKEIGARTEGAFAHLRPCADTGVLSRIGNDQSLAERSNGVKSWQVTDQTLSGYARE